MSTVAELEARIAAMDAENARLAAELAAATAKKAAKAPEIVRMRIVMPGETAQFGEGKPVVVSRFEYEVANSQGVKRVEHIQLSHLGLLLAREAEIRALAAEAVAEPTA